MEKEVRILVVSTEEGDFNRISDMLGQANWCCFSTGWAATFQEGIQTMLRRGHDVYFVDYSLGDQNGLQLIHRALDGGHPSPFILLTDREDSELFNKAESTGAADFLVKWQFTPDELARTIRYAINHARDLAKIWDLNADLEKKIRKRTASLNETVAQLKEQIQAKEQVQIELLSSQKILKQLIRGYGVGSFSIVDRHYQYVLSGGKSLQLVESPVAKPAGIRLFSQLPEEDWEKIQCEFDQVFEGAEIRDLNIPGTWDGRFFTVDAYPLRNLDGTIEKIAVMTRDVTDLRNAIEKMEKALESEKELGEMKSRFVSMASHEFRTPLTTIASSAFLIESYADRQDTASIKKHAARIRQSVDNLNTILGEFLSLGKLDNGRIASNLVNLNLRELVEEVSLELNHLLKTGQVVEYFHEGPEHILLDGSLLKNILINLLSNAVKYSPENSIVHVLTRISPAGVAITIRDEGIGIPETDQPKLFTRFFRAANAGNVQGTGLGLYIVKRYVNILNGAITFQSQLGKGSVFSVELPALPDPGFDEQGEKRQ